MQEPCPEIETWEKVSTILRRSVPRQQFETWFRGMRLLTLGPERAELTVPNNFLREWIHRKYFGVLRRALREVSGGDPEIDIGIADNQGGVREEEEAAPAPARERTAPARKVVSGALSRGDPFGESDVVLNPQYIFENFVPGPSNNFAYAAALAVADSPGKS